MNYKYDSSRNGTVDEFSISDEETMHLLEIASYLKI
jgi:hypothetical protein